MLLSIKSQRILERFGIEAAFARGETLVLVGPIYERRKEPGVRVRLAFVPDDQGRVCVGYASNEAGDWRAIESEPFSMRALGYYERRLKRIGNFVEHGDPGARR